MKILIIGASRGIGKQLLAFALDNGHEVSVLARNPDKIDVSHPRLRIVRGDVLDRAAVALAVAGQDAICLCFGIPPTRKPVEVFSSGTANVINAIGDRSDVMLLAITGVGAGDSKGHGGFVFDRIICPLLLRTIYEDKDRQEHIIERSRLKWIIVRPAMLTNGPRTGHYKLINNLAGVTSKKISRADVADFILAQLDEPTQLRKAPLLTY